MNDDDYVVIAGEEESLSVIVQLLFAWLCMVSGVFKLLSIIPNCSNYES